MPTARHARDGRGVFCSEACAAALSLPDPTKYGPGELATFCDYVAKHAFHFAHIRDDMTPASRAQEITDAVRRADQKRLPERAAEKAVEKMTNEIYLEVGKASSRALYLLGALVVGGWLVG